VLTDFLIALQFLTIVRVSRTLPFSETGLGRAGAFFPAVGLFLGAIMWGVDALLHPFFPTTLWSVVLVATLAILSRGLHLDGLADSADGLLGSTDQQRRLAIMKDSRIGTFGTLAVMLVLLLKTRAFDVLHDRDRTIALLLAPVLGRWACVAMAYVAQPARPEGLGVMFVRGTHFREFCFATAFSLILVLFWLKMQGFLVLTPLVILTFGFTRYCQRRLGGVTGDTLGALGELVETVALCFFAVLEPAVSLG
jgi:adenosylcobinamide-GDP ribazoletransferase